MAGTRSADSGAADEARTHFPWRATATVLIASVCLMAFGVFVEAMMVQRHLQTDRHFGMMRTLAVELTRLDEVLTMSALMYAATGSPTWEDRYLAHTPMLETKMEAALGVLPKDLRWDFETKTMVSSLRKEELERDALELVRSGDLAAAMAILSGEEYGFWKASYTDGVDSVVERLRSLAAEANEIGEEFARIRLAFHVIVGFALVLGWSFLLVRISGWRRELRNQQQRLLRTVGELNGANQAMEAGQRGLNRYRQAFDVSPEPMALVDHEERYLLVNPSFAALFGRRPEDILGKTVVGAIGADLYVQFGIGSIIKQCLAGEDLSFEGWRTFPAAGERYLSILYTPLRRLSGEVEGALVLLRDFTDRKRQEAKLEEARAAAVEADRAKSEFLATMSHELRTPLNGILGMAELLGNARLTEAERSYLEAIVDSGRSLSSLVNSILDFADTQSGRIEQHPVPFRPEQSLVRVVSILKPKAVQKGLDLSGGLADDVPQLVIADEERIRQVLFNLIWNGIKFTEVGSVSVEVAVIERDGERAVLRYDVIDTGAGIRDEDQARLFRGFVQLDSGMTRQHDGAGLGLAISQRLVRLMGGTIGVESDIGVGSRFWFTVPVDVAAPVEVELPAGPALAGSDPVLLREAAEQIRQLSALCLRALARSDVTGAADKADVLRSLAAAFDLPALAMSAAQVSSACRDPAADGARLAAGGEELQLEAAVAVGHLTRAAEC